MPHFTQLRVILFTAIVITLIFFVILVLKSEDILNQPEDNQQEKKTNVSIITTDVVEDQSWGSLAYKGQLKIEEEFPVTAELFSGIKKAEEIDQIVRKEAEQGSDLIIGHGQEFSNLFTKLAPSYPKVRFVTIHGTAKHSNQTVYTYRQSRVERVAAFAALLKTKTNKIGLIDPFPERTKIAGFEQGIQEFRPEATFYYSVVGSRENGKKAVELMDEMIKNGVDVIYSRGNGYNRDVIDYAKEKNIFVIGYLDDQSYLAENHVLTSVLTDVPQAYIAILKDYFSTEGMPFGKVILTEKDGVYKLAPPGPMYTDEEKREIRSKLVN